MYWYLFEEKNVFYGLSLSYGAPGELSGLSLSLGAYNSFL